MTNTPSEPGSWRKADGILEGLLKSHDADVINSLESVSTERLIEVYMLRDELGRDLEPIIAEARRRDAENALLRAALRNAVGFAVHTQYSMRKKPEDIEGEIDKEVQRWLDSASEQAGDGAA